MASFRAAVLLLLLMFAAGDGKTPGSAQERGLRKIAKAIVERAVSNFTERPTAVSEIRCLQLWLEALGLDASQLIGGIYQPPNMASGRSLPTSEMEKEKSQKETETELCEKSPSPMRAAARYQRPTKLACARSCLQLKEQGDSPRDGVYWFTGMPVPVLCDFSYDNGGWTLLLTAATGDGWNVDNVKSRNELSPSLSSNYAILRHADAIRDLGTTGRFLYRIEAQAEKRRQLWGGVWSAPKRYSFTHESDSQTRIWFLTRFIGMDETVSWAYRDRTAIKKRMPWIVPKVKGRAILTTSTNEASNLWGTLVSYENMKRLGYDHSPWIAGKAPSSGTVLYWIRENPYEQ